MPLALVSFESQPHCSVLTVSVVVLHKPLRIEKWIGWQPSGAEDRVSWKLNDRLTCGPQLQLGLRVAGKTHAT